MPTDLACKTCKGTKNYPPLTRQICPDCAGSGVAAWAVEAAAIEVARELANHRNEPDPLAAVAVWGPMATTILAAVREEAKNQ